MRGKKRYTNQTITKRVDHEAGRHRTHRAHAEPMVCEICGNVYADRRWSKPDPEGRHDKHEHFRPAQSTVCPACAPPSKGAWFTSLTVTWKVLLSAAVPSETWTVTL